MTTMLQNPARVKATRPFSAELSGAELRINGARYNVTPIGGIEDPDVRRCWRLEKFGDLDALYDVAATVHGLECTCPDFETRHRGLPTSGCKHVKALVAVGLLEATAAPVVETIQPAPVAIAEPAPLAVCELPTIMGAGLTKDERFRVTGARNRARSAYAHDARDASPGELDRVADRAATDALRAVLRDRPAAPELPVATAVCCFPAEPAPCAACVPAETVRTVRTPDVEPSPEPEPDEDPVAAAHRIQDEIDILRREQRRLSPTYVVVDDVCPQWTESEPDLTLETVIERCLRRIAAHPSSALCDLVVWHEDHAVAVLSLDEDERPYALRMDEHPEADGSIKTSVVRLADVESDPETWGPEWDEWLWTASENGSTRQPEPEAEPAPALLTLAEYVAAEASRYRQRETHAGDLIARTLAQLAETITFLHATTPQDFHARLEVMEQDDREPIAEPERTAAGQWA